ncbi:MAG: hypothetical protein FWD86_03185, partial [Firmicutes bacterium]|nr:hypothetical protein [Bacillota bacterium]
RFMVYFGAIFLIVGVLCLVWEFALTSGQALGIIALVAVVALLLATVFINSRFRYDAGDNRQGNYKNYHQRKADREAQAQENSNQNPNQAENQSNCKKYNFFGLNVEVDENENGENVSVKLGGLNINVVDGKNKESVNINLNGKDIVDISEDKKE